MATGANKGSNGSRATALSPGSIVATLDVGSTKISCHIAEVTAEKGQIGRGLRILGGGTTAARGVAHGAIANLDEAERAIRVAVDSAERSAKVRVHDVHVNIEGCAPNFTSVAAHVRVQGSVVAPRDVDNAVAAAMAKASIGRRSILHVSPNGFSLDGVESDEAPTGMHGEVLGVELGIVTVETAALRNLQRAVAQSHLTPASLSLSPLAAGRGVLLPDEAMLGAIVIDFGGTSTNFAAFRRGRLIAAGSLPVGGVHVTQDIAHGLSTTMAHAERLKTMFGGVLSLGHDERESIAVPLLGERGVDSVHHVPKSMLTAIVRPRIEETLELVHAGLSDCAGIGGISRIVLTGGASQLQGLRDLAAELFGCTVRIGQPLGLQGLPDTHLTPALAVSAGLFAMALYPERHVLMPQAAKEALDWANLGYVRRVGRWLKEAI